MANYYFPQLPLLWAVPGLLGRVCRQDCCCWRSPGGTLGTPGSARAATVCWEELLGSSRSLHCLDPVWSCAGSTPKHFKHPLIQLVHKECGLLWDPCTKPAQRWKSPEVFGWVLWDMCMFRWVKWKFPTISMVDFVKHTKIIVPQPVHRHS